MRKILLQFVTILCFQQLHAQYSNSFERWKFELSPKKDIGVLFTHNDSLEGMEVWLIDQGDTTNTYFLCSSERSLDIRFSPDEKWLVVNDHRYSNESIIDLYSRKETIRFDSVKVDINKEAWEVYAASAHLKEPPPYGHRYSKFLKWAKNSLSFKMKISGWDRTDIEDNRNDSVEDWPCTFDIKTLQIQKK